MVQSLTPSALAAMSSAPGQGARLDIVDVRDPDEWQTGHIAGARLVPLEQLRADPDAVLARGAVTVFVCAKGIRSLQAAKLADRFGYDSIYHLVGGTREWARAGYSLASDQRVAA
jgi:rhodanese-related sulfurtransferase